LACLTNNVDWAVRLTEAGPCANIIQKYEENPLQTVAGHKIMCRYSVYLKGVVPLEAHVSKRVQVLNAAKKFTMQVPSFGDEGVHLCTETCPADFYSTLADHEQMTARAVDAIRSVLRAFQVQFGAEIKEASEDLRREIYTVDIQFDAKKEKASV